MFFIYELGSGGAARTFVNITNHLNEQKFEPIIVTLNYDGSYERYMKDHVRLIKLDAQRLRSAIIPFARLIRKEQPDIVCSTIPNYNIVTILAKLLSRTNTKVIIREAAYLGGRMKENLKLLLYGLFYQKAHQVIALSEGVKDNLCKRYKVNERKIRVIYNPIDLETIQQQIKYGSYKRDIQSLFPSDRKIIVTAGRLVEEKDQQTLIRSFAKVNQQMASELFILGDGPLKQNLQSLAKELNIDHRVHFLGFQDNPYIYFHHADLFVLSSKREGFGHVFVEALASGTVIVSTNCKPGAKEVLDHGRYGFLCDVGDVNEMARKIVHALSIPAETKEEIIAKGYRRAQQFNAPFITNQYEDAFLEILGMGRDDKR